MEETDNGRWLINGGQTSSQLEELEVSKRPQLCDGVANQLREEIERQFSTALNRGGPIALVDLPAHLNIGDSLIGLGQFSVLKALSKTNDLRFVGMRPSQKVLREVNDQKGTILIHGGGNFGTLWPEHQKFREDLVRRCPNARIVQLPQSVYFHSAEELAQSMAVFQKHHDFDLMVRDVQSLHQMEDIGLTQLHLVPDTAFCLNVGSCGNASVDIVVIQRDDCESRGIDLFGILSKSSSDQSVISADWASFANLPQGFRWLKILDRVHLSVLRRVKNVRVCTIIWESLFKNRLKIGRRLISMGKIVVTDRLHVHILCSLMGKPHVFFDNSYGKISALAETWGTVNNFAIRATDVQSLMSSLDRLRKVSCEPGGEEH